MPRKHCSNLEAIAQVATTGLLTLEEVIQDMQRRGVRVILCEPNDRVKGKLAAAKVLALVGRENFFDEFGEALAQAGSAHATAV